MEVGVSARFPRYVGVDAHGAAKNIGRVVSICVVGVDGKWLEKMFH
jgi:hypothetical protein